MAETEPVPETPRVSCWPKPNENVTVVGAGEPPTPYVEPPDS